MSDISKVSGVVEDVIFHNDDNGYTIFVVDLDGTPLTCVGYTAFLAAGETVSLDGSYVTHMEYGEQFKFEYCQKVIPTTAQGIYRYLASGIVSGIREPTAKKLVEMFGDSVLDIILNQPKKLAAIKGITLEKAAKIGDSYAQIQGAQALVMFLQEYGVSVNIAIKIYKKLGQGAKDIIAKNPYVLSNDFGLLGFKTVDQIATNMGIVYNDDNRIKSAALYIMTASAMNNGHTYLLRNELEEYICDLVGVSDVEADNAIVSLMIDKKFYNEVAANKERIYLYYYYFAEAVIAKRIWDLSQNTFDDIDDNCIKQEIANMKCDKHIELAKEQTEAIFHAAKYGTLIITGGPGTGKTTTINTIINMFETVGLLVCLAAPTGRAAKRMSEVCSKEAKTIHRLLEINFADDESHQSFNKNDENQLDADVIIVDEMSMVDTLLFSSLLKAVKPESRLIMVGDCDQLASVGAGNVLEDLIKSDVVKTVSLSKIFRQAEESMIVVNAHKINGGHYPALNQRGKDFFFLNRENPQHIIDGLVDLCKHRIPKQYHVNPMYDIQVLAPTKKGMVGSINLNMLMQQALNPPSKNKKEKKHGIRVFRTGDKVMQIRNNYSIGWEKLENDEEGLGVFNGDMGYVHSINPTNGNVTVLFDDDKLVIYEQGRLDELEHAYAITIHKSQGSEFDIVVIPIYNAPTVLMTRNLLYTAITRAKKLIILVGKKEVMEAMIDNNTEKDRFTGLCDRLLLKGRNQE